MKSYIVDTYAWISYFEGRKEFQEAIEENELYTPSIVLAEVSRILTRRKLPKEKATQTLEFIKQRSLVLSLDESNAAKAGETADREGLHLIDGITYSYVDGDTRLVTCSHPLMGVGFLLRRIPDGFSTGFQSAVPPPTPHLRPIQSALR